MRKRFLFGFFLGTTMLFGATQQVFQPNQNSVREETLISNIKIDAETETVNVSNAQQFIDAAKADKNINIINDLDFSEGITQDLYGIDDYTQIITGNNHVIKNGKVFYNGYHQVYLFDHFNGEMHDVIFENFAFLIDELGDKNADSIPTEFKLTNIQLRNIQYANDQIIVHANDYGGIREISQGLFINKAYGYGIKDISVINSNISNINYQIIDDYAPNKDYRNQIIMGMFIGKAFYINIQGVYLINNSFSNNTISTIYSNEEKTEYINDKNPFTFGFFIGYISNSLIQDSFLNGNYVTDNLFEIGRPRIGGAFGFSESSTVKRMYQSSLFFEGNVFNSFEEYVNNRLGTFIGYDNSGKSTYEDIVVLNLSSSLENPDKGFDLSNSSSSFDIKANDFANFGLDLKSSIINSFYISDKLKNTKDRGLVYKNYNTLTLDFWKNVVGYSSLDSNDEWNLTSLVNSDLSISSDGTGFPLFNKIIFIFNDYEFLNDQLRLDFNTIIPEDLESFTVQNIFNDTTEEIEKNTASFLDTNIPKSQFNGLDDKQIEQRINAWFWMNAPEVPTESKVVLKGPLTSLTPKTYETPYYELTSDVSTLDSEYNEVAFDLNYHDDSFVVQNAPNLNEFQIASQYKTFNIDLENTNTLEIPNYIDEADYNSFYQIILNNDQQEYSYLASDGSTIETEKIEVNGVLTNTNDSRKIKEPSLDLNTEFFEASDTLRLELTMDDPDQLYIDSDYNLKNSKLTIHSPFKEFDPDGDENGYATTINLSSFNQIDNSFVYELQLVQTVFQNDEDISNYYWIDSNLKLEYYGNLSYQPFSIDGLTLSGDILASDGEDMKTYNEDETFSGAIETSINLEEKELEVGFKEDDAFIYLEEYQINLDLISANQVESFQIDRNHNIFEFQIDQELINYANAVGVENVDLNEYYAINYSEQAPSDITYIDNNGTTEVSELTNWNEEESINHNLSLRGVIVNTEDIREIPPVEEITSSTSSYWIITTLFALMILAAVLMALYSVFKPKNQV